VPGYVKQSSPFVVPTDDGKLIEEHFGLASAGGGKLSIAHMVAPSAWSEPAQVPEFDEYTLMISGRAIATVDGEDVQLKAGESILVKKGHRVCYSNPFSRPAEYWSVCLPAFSPDTVNREG
jgi:mannose-6-phosphate isomerase-like protein (cupin superfamily)